jgi:hypothetical protein
MRREQVFVPLVARNLALRRGSSAPILQVILHARRAGALETTPQRKTKRPSSTKFVAPMTTVINSHAM